MPKQMFLSKAMAVTIVLATMAFSVGQAEARVPVSKIKIDKVKVELAINVAASTLVELGKGAVNAAKQQLKPVTCSGKSGTANSTSQVCR